MRISKLTTAHSPDPKSNYSPPSFSFVPYESLLFQWPSSAPEHQGLWQTMLYNSVCLAYCPVSGQISPSLTPCQRIHAARMDQLSQVSCRGEKPCCGFWNIVTGLFLDCQGTIRSDPFIHTFQSHFGHTFSLCTVSWYLFPMPSQNNPRNKHCWRKTWFCRVSTLLF